nr:retrotransposon protein, putative, unclassified [Tanacetum cinerariifolium]
DTAMELTAYADADHAGCQDTSRSTSRSAQFLRDKLVSWSFKKQKSTGFGDYPVDSAHPFELPLVGEQVMDVANELGYPEEIHFVSKIHKIHRRPLSLIHVTRDDILLGNLKENLQAFPSKKVHKGKVMKVCKGNSSEHVIDEDEEVQPTIEPQIKHEEYDLQKDAETGADTGKTNSDDATKILDVNEEQGEDVSNTVALEERTIKIDKGQAGSDLESTKLYQDSFVNENLEDNFTFSDQFLNDKPMKEEPGKANVETKLESMVTVLIHQASSSVHPLFIPVINLTPLKPVSPLVQEPVFIAKTVKTTTLPLPPPSQQQSTINPKLATHVSIVEKIYANFKKKYKLQDKTTQALSSRIDLVNPKGNRVMPDVSKPLPLGGPPGQSQDLLQIRLHILERDCFTQSRLQRIQDLESRLQNLHPNDFEDLYLLHLQGKINHLFGADKVHIFNAANLWNRNIVIRQHGRLATQN